MLYNIPFYKNLDDDTHCIQAALKIVLGFYNPEKEYSFEELNKITAHVPGKWTWQYAMVDWLGSNGFLAVAIEDFDTEEFVEKGEEYLKKHWKEEVFATQKQFSNFSEERIYAKKALQNKNVSLPNKIAKFADLEKYYEEEYIVIASINPKVLDGEEGYASHVVVVTDLNDKEITFHDPGLPPVESRKVSREKFAEAMGESTSSVIAIKKI